MSGNKKFSDFLLTFLIIITLNFFIPRLMPGDPFMYLEAEQGEFMSNFSEEEIQRYRAYYDLDKPLLVQYKNYLFNMTKFDLGYSIYLKHPVLYIILSRLKWTIPLVLLSVFLSSFLGTVLGAISAINHNNKIDKTLYFIMIIFNEIPAFLLGIFFLFVLAANLKLFPISGGFSMYKSFDSVSAKFLDLVKHALLPCLTLVLNTIGGYYLTARNSMVIILSKSYINTAKAKGLKRRTIMFVHILRNSIFTIITKIFLSLGNVVGGAILVENVFAYPGLGTLMQTSIKTRDYPLLQGIFLVTAMTVLLSSFFADYINRKLNPRCGYE